MIKYIGSKRTLVPTIVEVVKAFPEVSSVIDLFSGTSRVGHALKRAGFQVFANDHNAYAATLARCYVQADREEHLDSVQLLLRELERLPGRPGYFTESFCVRSRFFQPRNGERVDAIRERIAALALDPELEAVVLVSLMEAADRVDSTTGVQMAYLKQWAPRAFNELQLRVPDLLSQARCGKGAAFQLDGFAAAAELEADVAYIDPPYNQHKYLGNYHIWESLVRWDKPEIYGVACKRIDCRERKSVFNSKPRAHTALRRIVESVRAKHLIVSFNDEGYISRDDMERMLAARGHVLVIEKDRKRYVGAQIGIHNPSGDKVGRVSHLRNREYIYVVSEDASRLDLPYHLGDAVQQPLAAADLAARTPEDRLSAASAGRCRAPRVSDDDLRCAVKEALAGGGWMGMGQLHQLTGASKPHLRSALVGLVSEGQVERRGRKRGTKYSLAQQDTASGDGHESTAAGIDDADRPAREEDGPSQLARFQEPS